MEVELMIRQALPSDAHAVVSLLKHVRQETNHVEMEVLSIDNQATLLADYAQSSCSILLLAELSGQIVGMGNLMAVSNEVAELGVCVRRAYWGYGIGTALVGDLMDFAEEVGMKQITLEVMRDNERAIRLYRAFNFVENWALSTKDRIWMMRTY